MGKRKKTLIEELFDRLDDTGRDVWKVSRRALGAQKKNKKSGSRKWAKRTNRELAALTEQVGLLVKHLDGGQPRTSKDEVRS